MFNEKRSSMLHGVLLIALFSCAAFYIGEMSFVRSISFSPMIVGIILGMLYANSLRNHLPETWVPGIQFCSKKILRIGIILYGFRLTFQDVMAIGLPAMLIDVIIVAVTICGGIYLGKLLKMDRGIALLTSIGSGICGAAAILGAESTIKAKPYKTAVSVSTVVIFGTISMFLYPFLYRNGLCALTPDQMGIYTGATRMRLPSSRCRRRDGKRYFGFCHHSENDSCDDVGSCASDYYLSGGESAEKTSAERTEVSEDCGALVCNRLYGCHRFQFF